jgi:hypothetical protein
MKNLLLSLSLVASSVHAAAIPAAHAMLPPALAKAVAEFDRAQIHGDRAALDRLLADDYVLVNSRAQTEDKAAFIGDYTAPGFTLEPFTVEHELIRHWNGGAVLGGVAMLRGTSGGKPYAVRLRFADIWRERDGRWQVIFTEAARVP